MRPTSRRGALSAAFVLAVSAVPAIAFGEEILTVTSDGRLVSFDSDDPTRLTRDRDIRGVAGTIVAIDVRPSDRVLYALTSEGRLYRLDPDSGVGTAVGTDAVVPGVGFGTGIDFDPVTGLLRVVNEQNLNVRVDPDTGAVVRDGDLFYDPADPQGGADPRVVAAAYDPNQPGTTAANLYAIDSIFDVLTRVDVPAQGRMTTIGALGVNATDQVGFDVSPSGAAYATITVAGTFRSGFYEVNLGTGGVALRGNIPTVTGVRAMTIGPAAAVPEPVRANLVGLTAGGELVHFSSDAPGTIARRVPVTGLIGGDVLVAIDRRPSGRLFGLGSGGRLYVIHGTTGAATPIRDEPFEVPLAGTEFGFDFNPAANLVRIVSDADLNLRVNPDTGVVADGDPATPGVQGDVELHYAPGDVNAAQDPAVTALAYDRTSARNGVTVFGIDTSLDVLVRLGEAGGQPQSPSTGVLHTIGELGFDATALTGFEVLGDSTAVAALTPAGGATRLYIVDLRTGRATPLGDVGTAETLRGLAAAPTSNPPAPGDALVVRNMVLRLDFDDAGRDSAVVTGTVPFPGRPYEGRAVTVDIGGFTETFTLDGAGRARNREDTRSGRDDDTFALVGRPREGDVGFVLRLRREDLGAALADEGLVDADARHESRTVRVTITIDGEASSTDVPLRWFARAGRGGVAVRSR